ncbi:hypothetical protein [Falsigemmobacter faecalis]|uniref:Uncharacterized protein n=1 Tax=Falsigemmobacter faecalis TaxID=2488730 RepID=A0A3P3D6G9_9RHOB|nr:hypothetical protein [Falsigemmobacter faecalis]RRH69042.1 hypothetical protein EG244_18965 [Falsigemmobacter faecalis]
MRLYQDAAGTTPAYEAGQPIGKVVRKAGTVDATQATALSRPTLARMPKGGRRNMAHSFGYSANSGVTVTPNQADPTGGMRACRVQFSSSQQTLSLCPSNPSPGPYSSRLFLKGIAGETIRRRLPGSAAEANIVLTGEWQEVGALNLSGNTGTFNINTWSNVTARDLMIYAPQMEFGSALGAYQHVGSDFDITEAGVPDVWHLWNDGGDSLLATFPAGTQHIAWVSTLGRLGYTTAVSTGTVGIDLLRDERLADVFARDTPLSDAERLRLETWWQERTGAWYLVPPGMGPTPERMWQTNTGVDQATGAGSPVGLLLDQTEPVGSEMKGSGTVYTSSTPTAIIGTYNPTTGEGTVVRDSSAAASGTQFAGIEVGMMYRVDLENRGTAAINLRASSITGSSYGGVAAGERVVRYLQSTSISLFIAAAANTEAPIPFTLHSIKKVPGNHAMQNTALSRPTLARWPKGGRRNLIGNTFAISTVSGVTATVIEPGTWELNNLSAAAGQRADWSVPADRAPPGSTLTFSLEVKSAGEYGSLAMIGIRNSAGASVSQAAYVERLTDNWQRMVATLTLGADNTNGAQLRINNRSGDANKVLVRNPQIEIGPATTPFQAVASITDIIEAGIPDIWHLYNDGGDSLPAVLPAGAWEIAWVTHLGVIGYASVTSDGTTGTDLLRAERMADVALKRGRFTSYEKAQLETQWGKYKP